MSIDLHFLKKLKLPKYFLIISRHPKILLNYHSERSNKLFGCIQSEPIRTEGMNITSLFLQVLLSVKLR